MIPSANPLEGGGILNSKILNGSPEPLIVADCEPLPRKDLLPYLEPIPHQISPVVPLG